MKRFSMLVLVILAGSLIVRAQGPKLAVNVYKPVPDHGTMGLVKLFLNGRELPVVNIQSPPEAALHVVFVLDNGDHQQRMMKLAKNYVAALASDLLASHGLFTVVLAAKVPQVVVENSSASELTSVLMQSSTAKYSGEDESADLNGGIAKAVSILVASAGL